MSGSTAPPPDLALAPDGAPPSGAGSPRLSTFGRVQLLIVLWILFSEVFRGGAGVTMLPELSTPATPAPVNTAAIVLRVASAAIYALLALVVSRRFPLWHRTARHTAYLLGVLAGLHALAFVASAQLNAPFSWLFYVHRTFEFGVFAVFAHGMLYGERYHAKEREELRLRAEMAGSAADRTRAQVRALKMEWSPRFLTETLKSIGELLLRDVAAAKRLLLGLSSVLRRTLAHARTETLRLEQEVEFVREVLRVEALRRPGLKVDWTIDEAALEMPVPHMALVTMVYQGLPQDEGASPIRIRISATAAASAVDLCVDVHGMPAHPGPSMAPREEIGADRGAAYAGGHALRRASLGADGVRLELRCESEPEEAVAGPLRAEEPRPASLPSVSATPSEGAMAIGGNLEWGTYAAFALFYTLLTLYTAWARVEAGRVALAAPAWVYVAGMGAYAALWWGSMAMAARFLSIRFPFRHGTWARRIVPHLLGALLVAVLNAAAFVPFQQLVVARGGEVLIGFLSYWEWGDVAIYPPLAGIAHGFIYAREYHARRISEMRLRSLLSESELSRTRAELQALKAELNPHFLFNALNTVSSLMHTRVDEARRVVAHLSALLRHVLESSGVQEVTVEEEVEFIRLYMEIEQARFGDALRIDYRVDPATLRARVPHLLIQPLVENAVKHGLRPRGGTGRVVLSTRRADGHLELTVADDGVGPAHEPPADGTGTGLANVRERLRQIYGAAHAFEFAAAPGGGARAYVRIPFSEQPRAVPAGESARAPQAV